MAALAQQTSVSSQRSDAIFHRPADLASAQTERTGHLPPVRMMKQLYYIVAIAALANAIRCPTCHPSESAFRTCTLDSDLILEGNCALCVFSQFRYHYHGFIPLIIRDYDCVTAEQLAQSDPFVKTESLRIDDAHRQPSGCRFGRSAKDISTLVEYKLDRLGVLARLAFWRGQHFEALNYRRVRLRLLSLLPESSARVDSMRFCRCDTDLCALTPLRDIGDTGTSRRRRRQRRPIGREPVRLLDLT